jgi:hypothetical protein
MMSASSRVVVHSTLLLLVVVACHGANGTCPTSTPEMRASWPWPVLFMLLSATVPEYVNVTLQRLHLYRAILPFVFKMKPRGRRSERCSSASRVTAKLLLSFLAIAVPARALHQAPVNPQIALPPITPSTRHAGRVPIHEFVPSLHPHVD